MEQAELDMAAEIASLKTATATRPVNGNGAKDALGQRLGTFSAHLNTFVIPILEKGQLYKLNAKTLAAMTGGEVSVGRWNDHLSWMRRKNFI